LNLKFEHRLIVIITILFREGPTFLPSRILLLNSIGAFLLGTFYETFITSETVIPEPDRVFDTLHELFENNYRILYPNHTYGENGLFETLPPEVAHQQSFKKHKIAPKPKHFLVCRNESDYSSGKIAQPYIGNPQNGLDLEEAKGRGDTKWRILRQLCDMKTTYWKFQHYSAGEYLRVVQILNQIGITRYLEQLKAFKDNIAMKMQIREALSESGNVLNQPKPISIVSKLITIFYVWMTILSIGTCIFLIEAFILIWERSLMAWRI